MQRILLVLITIAIYFDASSQVGQIQIVHNSPDPALSTLDLYFQGNLIIDDINFRDATQYRTVLAGVDVNFGIAPANSTSVDDTLRNFVLHFEDGDIYNIFIGGVLNTDSFDVNPQGKGIDFNIFINTQARDAALDTSRVEFLFYNGVTDAPPFTITDSRGRVFGTNLKYGERTAYFSNRPEPMIINLNAGLGNYMVNFLGYKGESAVIFTSGFVKPENNQMGEDFGVFVVYSDGTVVQLQEPVSARIQFINASPDPSLDSFDVYVENRLYFDNFSYLDATPFLTFPADSDLTVKLTPPESQTTFYTRDIKLDSNETYIAVITGLLPPLDSIKNPDGKSTAIQMSLQKGMKEAADTVSEFDFKTFNAIPDAPAARVFVDGQLELENTLAYNQFRGYYTLPAEDHSFDLTDSSSVYASFSTDFTALSGKAGLVLFSGLLSPIDDKAVVMNVVLPDGQVLQFVNTGIIEDTTPLKLRTYPNPFNEGVWVDLPQYAQHIEISVTDMSGRIIKRMVTQPFEQKVFLNLSEKKPGFYLLRVKAGQSVGQAKLIKLH